MTEEQARKILKTAIQPDGSLFDLGTYLAWSPHSPANTGATLDGEFSLDELEAIVWWMKNWKPTA